MEGGEPPKNKEKSKIRKIRPTEVTAMPDPNSVEYIERRKRAKEAMSAKSKEGVTEEDSVETLFDQAFELEKQGDGEQALAIYKKIVEEIDPNNARVFANMGTIYYSKMRDLEEAEKCYKRALEIDSKYALVNFNMAKLKEEERLTEEAITYYLKAIESNPMYSDAHYNLGLLYEGRGEYLKAIEQSRRYLNITTNDTSKIGSREMAKINIEECQKKLAEKDNEKK